MERLRLLFFLLLTLLTGCGGSDGTTAPVVPVTPPKHVPISQVFVDFESAYNSRDIAKYSRIVDDNFVFHLTTVDQTQGRPAQWGRAVEIEYTTKLFDPNYQGAFKCDSLYFKFHYPHVISLYTFNPASAPNETWYRTVLPYDFWFKFGPVEIAAAPGNQAAFTIRNAGTEAAPVWKIVELRDYGPFGIQTQSAAMGGALQWTLGAVKAVYSPPPP